MKRERFAVGCFFLAFAAVMFVWAFQIGTLTPDQRRNLHIILSIASGLAAGSFSGVILVKADGWVPGVVATATGGFAVWFLSALFLQGPEDPFSVTVQPHGPGGIFDKLLTGAVHLQIGSDVRNENIDPKGLARFENIPSNLDGTTVKVGVTSEGFEMVEPGQDLRLVPGAFLPVEMKKVSRWIDAGVPDAEAAVYRTIATEFTGAVTGVSAGQVGVAVTEAIRDSGLTIVDSTSIPPPDLRLHIAVLYRSGALHDPFWEGEAIQIAAKVHAQVEGDLPIEGPCGAVAPCTLAKSHGERVQHGLSAHWEAFGPKFVADALAPWLRSFAAAHARGLHP